MKIVLQGNFEKKKKKKVHQNPDRASKHFYQNGKWQPSLSLIEVVISFPPIGGSLATQSEAIS